MDARAALVTLWAATGFMIPSPSQADEPRYFGLLRARDLTTFGFLRLDMRPAHAVQAPPGAWAVEAELAQQNTWALSRGARDYLDSRPQRRPLGPVEVAAIRALPGENYLFDMELAQLDVTLHHQFTERLGAYVVLSGVNYSGGFLDGSIERFHEAFGFDDNGRPAVRRNDVNLVADLDSADFAFLGAPTHGGLLDPTLGLRWSVAEPVNGWDVVVEAAVKLPVQGQEDFLSTGRADTGVQATFQRFGDHHAWYVSASGVWYDGRRAIAPTGPRIVPTLVLGYERRVRDDTHLILQAYASDSVYTRDETRLDELLDVKYQLSLGIYRRLGRGVLSFAVTENLQNFNNTPDVGLQLGFAFSPALGDEPR